MKVLSLFDGMACGMLAMMDAGIEVERYVAFEIDKYAVQTSTHNFPMIEQRGDVFNADFTEFAGFDWLVGGSPCTYWSIAQTKNRETVASGMGWELFSQYVRALHEAKPRFFIYENNKSMSKAIKESITETFGFEPILINSALVSAQNRQRLYWVGIRNDDGTYRKANIDQPEDRGILLKDILETGETWRDKAHTIDATYYKGGTLGGDRLHQNSDRLMVAEPIRVGEIGKGGQGNRIYSVDGKSVAQTENSGGIGSNTGLYAEPICTTDDEKSHTLKAQYYKNGIANFITNGGFAARAVAEPYIVKKQLDELKIGVDKSCTVMTTESHGWFNYDKTGVIEKAGCYEKSKQIYEVKSGMISVKGKQYPIKLQDGFYIIRKLTVRECMRLQTVPEWYEFPVSNSQAYKMLGNGWTIQVISHLIRSVMKEVKQ